MPLTKVKPGSNMYQGWVTHTHTHIGGECPHRCKYCYVQATERRFGGGHYVGDLRLIEKEFTVRYGMDKTIFIEHCNDMFANEVPESWINRILDHCNAWPCNTYVFQTKNPARYHSFTARIPKDSLLGCTIETDCRHTAEEISDAPSPILRYADMLDLSRKGYRTFITIEPVLDMNPRRLAKWIEIISPEFVNIGADSKGTGLPEPSKESIEKLIELIQKSGVPIKKKSNLNRILGDD